MRLLIISLAIMLVSFQVSGQKKSKMDPKDAQIDTLTKVNTGLTLKLDSVSKELVKYMGVYDAIKGKVLHYDFDPTRSAYLIDSLKASRDSTSYILLTAPKPAVSPDSLTVLMEENLRLRSEIDSIKAEWLNYRMAVPPEEIEKANAIGNLKELKELLDERIITEAEFLILKKKYIDKL